MTPVELGRKLNISPDVCWCQREFPSIYTNYHSLRGIYFCDLKMVAKFAK